MHADVCGAGMVCRVEVVQALAEHKGVHRDNERSEACRLGTA
jgi:hypothetical protein